MYCKTCGTAIPDDSKFCFSCGTKVDLFVKTDTPNTKQKEIKFQKEINELNALIDKQVTGKIQEVINRVVDSKENGIVFIKNYFSIYKEDVIKEILNVSNHYDTIKQCLQKFIDLRIVEPHYPHDRIDKIIVQNTSAPKIDSHQFTIPWMRILFVVVIASVVIAWVTSTNNNVADDTRTTENKTVAHSNIGDEISVEHFVYQVNTIRFAKSIGNEFLNQKADGIYLIVDLSLVNNDNVEHTIDNNFFIVTDEKGREFETTLLTGMKTLFLEQCNPGVQKRGNLVFEVPSKGVYYLHLSGSIGTDETAIVKLTENER